MSDPTAIPGFGPIPSTPHRQASVRERVTAILTEFGFDPQTDPDGDIMYTVEDQTLFVRVNEDDSSALVRIFGQWHITDDITSDVTKRLDAANDVTLSLNIIKVGIVRDMMVVSGEHFVAPGLDLQMVVASTSEMILRATQLWYQSVNSDGGHISSGGTPSFAPDSNGDTQG